MYRLVLLDQKLEEAGIEGRFIRAYLSVHLLINYERHASQETKKLNFIALRLNEQKIRLLCQDIYRTAACHKHVHLQQPSSLLRNLAAVEFKIKTDLDFCALPQNWENFIGDAETEENIASFVEKKCFRYHEVWPFKRENNNSWVIKVWHVWQTWVERFGDEDKALWELQVAALKQLLEPTPVPTQPQPHQIQPRLFDFAGATTAA